MGKFTAEEIQIAKAVDLVDLAEQIGIPLKRKGRFYQAVGMDSVMIFNRSSWCRFSQGVGGSTIDFLDSQGVRGQCLAPSPQPQTAGRHCYGSTLRH